jgi:selenocysteine lyase/cysteine desulfurase
VEVAMIPCQRHRFEIPEEVAYLNCAYMSPLARPVVAAGEAGLRRKARPWTIGAPDFFDDAEKLRELFARLIGASAGDVALAPSASYGIAVAANNLALEAGRNVVVLDEQFPSNMYAWRRRTAERGAELRVVRRAVAGDWTDAVVASIDERTAYAALPHCHWTDGALVDLPRVARALRQVGAGLVLDLSQSLGALPIDVGELDPDFVVCPTYKWLLGPYGCGFLYAAPRHHGGAPLEHNWNTRAGAEDFAGLVRYRDEYRPGARRYDVGEFSNFALLPAVLAALELVHEWGVERIRETLAARTAAIARRAADELGLESVSAERRAGHYLGLRFGGGLPVDLLPRLAERGVWVSVRGDSMRVTPHVYNTDEDVERLFAALHEVVRS